MSDAEKVAAFDLLATCLTNRWHDGSWTWWCPDPAGSQGTKRATQAEALADLIEWARETAPKWAAKNARMRVRRDGGKYPLPILDA